MKRILLFVMVTMITGLVSAQYVPSVQESAVTFKIRNFGFEVSGKFTGIQGTINFDPQNPAKGNIDVTVDAGSIDTDNSMRDKHLKGESYFDIAEYPNIHFVSTGIEPGAKGEMFILTGKLTIKNTVREIKFPFAATATGDGYMFKGSFKIKRKDFNVGGTSTISDELEVSLNVQAKKA